MKSNSISFICIMTMLDKRLIYRNVLVQLSVSCIGIIDWLIDLFIVFNATFSNISAISWRPILVLEVAGVPGENHRP
jgi:hypothetical protein